MIVVAATVLTLFIEYPFLNIKKLIFDEQPSEEKKASDINHNKLTSLDDKRMWKGKG